MWRTDGGVRSSLVVSLLRGSREGRSFDGSWLTPWREAVALAFSAPVADGGNQQLMWVPVRCFMKGTGPVTTKWLIKSPPR